MPKTVFLNRLYNGTPVVLDQNVSYTKEVKISLLQVANQIWNTEEEIERESVKKKKGLFGLFSSDKKKEKKGKKVKKEENNE